MIIASVHVALPESEVPSFGRIAARCKKVLHQFGIHSSTVQPEFISDNLVCTSEQEGSNFTRPEKFALKIVSRNAKKIGAAKMNNFWKP